MICPVCRKESANVMAINFIERIEWARCSCGCIYQCDPKESDPSKEYVESYKQKKFYDTSSEYPVVTYFPLIEEMTYGRRFLEVDSIDPKVARAAERRGWISYVITKEKQEPPIRFIEDKFTDLNLPKEAKFDCIYSYHNLDKTLNFKEVISKFHQSLNPTGVLFLACPDSEFVDELGVTQFNHWYSDNKIIFSRKEIVKALEFEGFSVVLARANNSSRFIKNNDFHIIAQRGL